jgi:ribonuclease Z
VNIVLESWNGKNYCFGSSNAVAKKDQQNTHLLLRSNTRTILVDCGDHPVASLTAAGIGLEKLTDIVLTHFHADHVGSLPLLIMDMWLEKRTAPLTIYGLAVTIEKARKLLELFDWQNWQGLFPVEFKIIHEGSLHTFLEDQDLSLSAMPVLHLIPTIGLRAEFASGRVVSYSCDTEPCPAVEVLAQCADIHFQEAAGQSKGHTSAAQAGEIATRCGVKKLILIHYESRSGKDNLLVQARSTFQGEVELAYDGMEL